MRGWVTFGVSSTESLIEIDTISRPHLQDDTWRQSQDYDGIKRVVRACPRTLGLPSSSPGPCLCSPTSYAPRVPGMCSANGEELFHSRTTREGCALGQDVMGTGGKGREGFHILSYDETTVPAKRSWGDGGPVVSAFGWWPLASSYESDR